MLLVAVFLLSLVSNMAGAVFSIAACGYIVLKRGKTKFDSITVALIVCAIFTGLMTLVPLTSPVSSRFQECVRFAGLAALSMYVIGLRFDVLKRLITFILLTISLTSMLYISTGAFSIIDSSSEVRFASLFPHSNHLGYVCASIIILFVSAADRLYTRTVNYIHLSLAVFALLLSQSSGAVLTAIAGSAFALILKADLKLGRSLASIFLCAAAALFVYSNQWIISSIVEKIAVVDFYTVQQRAYSYSFGGQDSSFAWRLSYWLAIIDSHVNSGWTYVILGQGGGSTLQGRTVFDFMTHDPHNDFLRVFVEFGALGLLLIVGSLAWGVLSKPSGLIASVVMFGPMLAGNSLVSFPVMLVVLVVIRALSYREVSWRAAECWTNTRGAGELLHSEVTLGLGRSS